MNMVLFMVAWLDPILCAVSSTSANSFESKLDEGFLFEMMIKKNKKKPAIIVSKSLKGD